ncbi:MAG: enoyl-CoA hydratase-related protein [Vulcanimicrobiaceae bacterium]
MHSAGISVGRVGDVARVTLDRPHVRNAFDAATIAALTDAFVVLGRDPAVRAIVLAGSGAAFCAGADRAGLRASRALDDRATRVDARALSRMFRAIDRSPKLVVARVQGFALGGGAGLVAVADVAIAAADARFGFTETKIGLLPAVISPFVLGKIGASHARALALTGERFDAERARHVGLVHEIVASERDLDAAVARVTTEGASASPTALAATKALFARVAASDDDASLDLTAEAIAAQRTSAEGQDGMRAFLEKRPPVWMR